MKKIFTAMFALIASASAFAVPTYTVSPEDGSVIENRDNFTVTFEFSEKVKADSVQFASGPRFNRTMTMEALTMGDASTIIKVPVSADKWGEVVGNEYVLSVTLTNLSDANGTPITISEIDPETKEEITYDFKAAASYTSPDTTPASYLRYEPTTEEVSAWEAYNDGWGAVDFIFSGEVEMTDQAQTATVVYMLSNGEMPVYVIPADEIWADWNFWTGEYVLSVMLPVDDSLTESTLAAVMVSLSGIKSNGVTLNTATATYMAKSTKSLNANGIVISNPASRGKYSIQGTTEK